MSAQKIRPTDIARWSERANLDDKWNARAARAVSFVPPGATVLDVGCGKMFLEQILPPGCRYIPLDLVARDERTIVCDLNRGEYPRVDGVTHAVALGVLEYLHDERGFFRWLAGIRPARLILSYVALDTSVKPEARRRAGWVSDLTFAEIVGLATDAGFSLADVERINANNRIFVFTGPGLAASPA